MADQFLRQLAILQEQNFGAGLVKGAQAELLKAQSESSLEVINQLNERLRAMEGQPKTQEEQLAALNEMPEAKDALTRIGDLSKQMIDYQASILDYKEMYGDAYDQAIQNLAFIGGEDAIGLANALAQRKASKLDNLSEKSELPMRVMEYQKAHMSLVVDKEKLFDIVRQRERLVQLEGAMTDISSHPLFADIPKGEVNTYSYSRIEKLNKIISAIQSDLKGKYDASVVETAMAQTLNNYGTKIRYEQQQPNNISATQRLESEATLGALAGQLQGIKEEFTRVDPTLKLYIEDYLEQGILPDNEINIEGVIYDATRIRNLAEQFTQKWAITYSSFNAIGQSLYPDWNAVVPRGTSKDDKGVEIVQSVPKYYSDIPRPLDSTGLFFAKEFLGGSNPFFKHDEKKAKEVKEGIENATFGRAPGETPIIRLDERAGDWQDLLYRPEFKY